MPGTVPGHLPIPARRRHAERHLDWANVVAPRRRKGGGIRSSASSSRAAAVATGPRLASRPALADRSRPAGWPVGDGRPPRRTLPSQNGDGCPPRLGRARPPPNSDGEADEACRPPRTGGTGGIAASGCNSPTSVYIQNYEWMYCTTNRPALMMLWMCYSALGGTGRSDPLPPTSGRSERNGPVKGLSRADSC